MPEQMEMKLPLKPAPLPEIVTLREFVAQMEREYGPCVKLEALRAALEGTNDD